MGHRRARWPPQSGHYELPRGVVAFGTVLRGGGPVSSADEIKNVQRAAWPALRGLGEVGLRPSWSSSARSAQR